MWEWVGTWTSGRASSTLILLAQLSKEGVVVEMVEGVELIMGVVLVEALVEAMQRRRKRRQRWQLGGSKGGRQEEVDSLSVAGSRVDGQELVVLGLEGFHLGAEFSFAGTGTRVLACTSQIAGGSLDCVKSSEVLGAWVMMIIFFSSGLGISAAGFFLVAASVPRTTRP